MNPDKDKILRWIAEGYLARVEEDRYIVINNPSYNPMDGSDPYIVYDVDAELVPDEDYSEYWV